METTDAFRARFEENYYALLIKKGMGARPPVPLRQPVAQVPVARPQVHLRNGAWEVPEASQS